MRRDGNADSNSDIYFAREARRDARNRAVADARASLVRFIRNTPRIAALAVLWAILAYMLRSCF